MEETPKPLIQDPKTGRFVKGNKAHLRRSNNTTTQAAVLASIEQEFPAAETGLRLREAYDIARLKGWVKVMVRIEEMVLDRRIGKPVQQNMNVNAGLNEWREIFGGADAEETMEVVEGEIVEGME